MIFKYNIYKEILNCGPNEEPFILESPKASYFYAKDKLRRRWPQAEEVILESLEHSVLYAKNVIKGRWPEFEAIAPTKQYYSSWGSNCSDNKWFFFYVKNVMKERWPEVEKKIIKSPNIGEYERFLKTDEEKTHYKNLILTEGIKSNNISPLNQNGESYLKKNLEWEPTHILKYNRTKTEVIVFPVLWSKINEKKDKATYSELSTKFSSIWAFNKLPKPDTFWKLKPANIFKEDDPKSALCSFLIVTKKDYMEKYEYADIEKIEKLKSTQMKFGNVVPYGSGFFEPKYLDIVNNTIPSFFDGNRWCVRNSDKYKNLGKLFIERGVLYYDLKQVKNWTIEKFK